MFSWHRDSTDIGVGIGATQTLDLTSMVALTFDLAQGSTNIRLDIRGSTDIRLGTAGDIDIRLGIRVALTLNLAPEQH